MSSWRYLNAQASWKEYFCASLVDIPWRLALIKS